MTDIEKYDRAVFSYLSTISARVVYAPTNSALKTITRKEQFSDNKPWDFISFYRNPSFDINWDRMNNYATVAGDNTKLTSENNQRKAQYVQNLQVNLTYSVNIWASKAADAQSMAIALITKIFMTNQVIEVPINPDNSNGRFHILNVSWDDNSDIEREAEIGKIYRHTINFTVDAQLIRVTEVNTVQMCCAPINIYNDGGETEDED